MPVEQKVIPVDQLQVGMYVANGRRYAAELGISAESAMHGSFELGDETIFHVSWREWRRRLEAGIAKDAAQ